MAREIDPRWRNSLLLLTVVLLGSAVFARGADPSGATAAGPPAPDGVDAMSTGAADSVAKRLKDIKSVLVRAPSEALRVNAESVLSKSQGPNPNPDGDEYDAVLVIGMDCGKGAWNLWTGAHYCTCEGTLGVESGGVNLWSTTEAERSASAAKAGKKLVVSMTEDFVRSWKKAHRKD